jgi:hypothetical protein
MFDQASKIGILPDLAGFYFPIWQYLTSGFGTVLLPDLEADWNGSGPFWVLTTNQRIRVHPGSDNPLRQEGVSNRQ